MYLRFLLVPEQTICNVLQIENGWLPAHCNRGKKLIRHVFAVDRGIWLKAKLASFDLQLFIEFSYGFCLVS